MTKQNEPNEKNVFLLRVRAGHIVDMKKLLPLCVLILLFAPTLASADSTYTCSNSGLAPITVANPTGSDGAQVSAYIQSCSNAGGTVTGPSAQQLSQTSTASQTTSGTQTTSFCNGQTCTYVPLEPIPGIPQNGQDFAGFLKGVFRLLFTIGGMVAVASLVYGGVTYMISEVVNNKEWAKKQMRASLWGLLLLTAAWLILNTISPDLVTFKFNPTPINSTGGGYNTGTLSGTNTSLPNANTLVIPGSNVSGLSQTAPYMAP